MLPTVLRQDKRWICQALHFRSRWAFQVSRHRLPQSALFNHVSVPSAPYQVSPRINLMSPYQSLENHTSRNDWLGFLIFKYNIQWWSMTSDTCSQWIHVTECFLETSQRPRYQFAGGGGGVHAHPPVLTEEYPWILRTNLVVQIHINQ